MTHDCTAHRDDPLGPECRICGRRADPDGDHAAELNGCADCNPDPYICPTCPELDGRHTADCPELEALAAELEPLYRDALAIRQLWSRRGWSIARAGGNLYRILEGAPRSEWPTQWRDRPPSAATIHHLACRIADGSLRIVHDGLTYDLYPVMNPWPIVDPLDAEYGPR